MLALWPSVASGLRFALRVVRYSFSTKDGSLIGSERTHSFPLPTALLLQPLSLFANRVWLETQQRPDRALKEVGALLDDGLQTIS